MSRFQLLGVSTALSLAIFVAGCLNATQSGDAYYDKATDTLHLLVVEQGIAAPEAADKAYAAALWHNRSDLIPDFFHFQVLSTNAMLRLGDHQCLSVSLGQTQPRPPTTAVDYNLDRIRIEPGVFFRGDSKNSLCYYQQIEIPGTVMDAMLASAQKDLLANFASSASDEITRRKAGGKLSTWDDFRSTLSIAAPPESKLSDAQKTDRQFNAWPFHCLTDASLAMLAAPPPGVKAGFARQGNQVSLAIPLAPPDQQELIKTAAIIKKQISLDFDISAGPGNAVTLATTLVNLAEAASGGQFSAFQPDASATDLTTQPAAPPAPPDWITTFGGKLNPNVTLANLHDQFMKGTLPVDQAPTSDKTRAELFKAGP